MAIEGAVSSLSTADEAHGRGRVMCFSEARVQNHLQMMKSATRRNNISSELIESILSPARCLHFSYALREICQTASNDTHVLH